jgi:hypothetical protein
MDSYGVIELGNTWLSIPGAILWCFFAMVFLGVVDKAQTKTGSIVAFTLMLGSFTILLMNLGWFFVVSY